MRRAWAAQRLCTFIQRTTLRHQLSALVRWRQMCFLKHIASAVDNFLEDTRAEKENLIRVAKHQVQTLERQRDEARARVRELALDRVLVPALCKLRLRPAFAHWVLLHRQIYGAPSLSSSSKNAPAVVSADYPEIKQAALMLGLSAGAAALNLPAVMPILSHSVAVLNSLLQHQQKQALASSVSSSSPSAPMTTQQLALQHTIAALTQLQSQFQHCINTNSNLGNNGSNGINSNIDPTKRHSRTRSISNGGLLSPSSSAPSLSMSQLEVNRAKSNGPLSRLVANHSNTKSMPALVPDEAGSSAQPNDDSEEQQHQQQQQPLRASPSSSSLHHIASTSSLHSVRAATSDMFDQIVIEADTAAAFAPGSPKRNASSHRRNLSQAALTGAQISAQAQRSLSSSSLGSVTSSVSSTAASSSSLLAPSVSSSTKSLPPPAVPQQLYDEPVDPKEEIKRLTNAAMSLLSPPKFLHKSTHQAVDQHLRDFGKSAASVAADVAAMQAAQPKPKPSSSAVAASASSLTTAGTKKTKKATLNTQTAVGNAKPSSTDGAPASAQLDALRSVLPPELLDPRSLAQLQLLLSAAQQVQQQAASTSPSSTADAASAVSNNSAPRSGLCFISFSCFQFFVPNFDARVLFTSVFAQTHNPASPCPISKSMSMISICLKIVAQTSRRLARRPLTSPLPRFNPRKFASRLHPQLHQHPVNSPAPV